MGAVNPSGKPFMQIQFTMETKENNNEKTELESPLFNPGLR